MECPIQYRAIQELGLCKKKNPKKLQVYDTLGPPDLVWIVLLCFFFFLFGTVKAQDEAISFISSYSPCFKQPNHSFHSPSAPPPYSRV